MADEMNQGGQTQGQDQDQTETGGEQVSGGQDQENI
jgi:hypothetical protein